MGPVIYTCIYVYIYIYAHVYMVGPKLREPPLNIRLHHNNYIGTDIYIYIYACARILTPELVPPKPFLSQPGPGSNPIRGS